MQRPLFLLLMFMLCSVQLLFSQNISVKSFRLLPTDLTARVDPVTNDNGQTCALVKIVTTERGFEFDPDALGMCGAVDESHAGEVRIWLSPGSRRITIRHRLLGVLRDYEYPVAIESACTYEMVLVTGRVTTVVEEQNKANYLVLNVTPPEAMVKIDGEVKALTNGQLSAMFPVGSHTYEIYGNLHHPQSGKFVIEPDHKTTLELSLKPNYGFVSVKTEPESGASVFVNGSKMGETPYKSDRMASGDYIIQVAKDMYKSATRTVTVTDNQTAEVTLTLAPNFAEPVFTCADSEAEIWVNGEKKGTGSWSGRLPVGVYKVEARKTSHRPTVLQLNLEAGGKDTKTLDAPIPILGKINVNSTPHSADILLDGKKVGTTPEILNQVLVGKHELKIEKAGCSPETRTVTVEEGKMTEVNVELNVQKGPQTETITVNGVSFTMVAVKGGTFTMGCTSEQDSDCYAYEKPAHQVTVSDFYIGETEVTQALWMAVMGSNPSKYPGDNRPVECVSWDDCQEFILKLNQQTGKRFRLPTEAEWEYAAQGGSQNRGYKYSGSNMVDDVAWYWRNSGDKYLSYKEQNRLKKVLRNHCITHSVKTKQANELGLYDMSGNVYEWCSDWYGDYSSSAQTNPTGPSSGPDRVIRGGCWFNNARGCRISVRYTFRPAYTHHGIGLRLVMEVENGENDKSSIIPVDNANAVGEGTTPGISSPMQTQNLTVNGVSFTMVAVKGGTFTMGCTYEQRRDCYCYDDEKPAHQVTLSDFCIGETEVTQALWKAVMGSNPSNFKGDDLPVENVSWDDCQKFIRKLNQQTGKSFRLPTEAEWEYAARGGSQSRGYKYSGSNNLDEVAWYNRNSGYKYLSCKNVTWKKKHRNHCKTHTVKTKQANELGLYDMSGNVYEWCSDWYGDYSSSAQTNPTGPSSGTYRVSRGGGWSSIEEGGRVSQRCQGWRSNSLGLRLVMEP